VPPRLRPSKDSIRSDILIVNDSILSVAELLYPLRDWIERTRQSQTARGFVEQLNRRIREHVHREIRSLLMFEKALADVPDPARASLDDAIGHEIDNRVSREFGGSVARFENHLLSHGLTIEQFRAWYKRKLLVSSYTREVLAPQIRIPRHELLAYYRANIKRYSTEETREFRLIEVQFARFLPAGVTWQAASQTVQDQAKLQALRRARAAHEILAQRNFADVAREYSHGVHADAGGSWGPIGQPLQPPYDEVSRRIFEFEEEQYSEPIQTATGWCIVQCGRIEPATKTVFADVQEEIRTELENERFNKLAGDYIYRLAERATISDLNAFVNSAVERAITGWSAAPGD
jgi:hypothetical protein